MQTLRIAGCVVVAGCVAATALAQDAAPRAGRRGAMGSDWRARMQERERGELGGAQSRGMPMNAAGRETMLARFVNNPEVAAKLGMSSNQVKVLSEKLDLLQKDKVKVRAEMEIAGMEQAKLLAADAIDEAAVMAAVDRTGTIYTRLAKLEVQALIELKKIMTPAQIAQAKALVSARIRDWGNGAANPRRGNEDVRQGAGPEAPPPLPPPPAGDAIAPH
jgi:Spy/CpxP family protein refolding chaperone